MGKNKEHFDFNNYSKNHDETWWNKKVMVENELNS